MRTRVDTAARRRDPVPSGVRDPFGNPRALAASLRRPMPERLELALSWNAIAAELRAGVAAQLERSPSRR